MNFTVEDGLIQSQAIHIIQDKNKYLWIATEGGICKFDGRNFIKYSTQDGLVSNFTNKLLCDSKGKIWVATKKGLSIFDGKKFNEINYGGKDLNNINFLNELPNNTIYGLHNNHLCTFANLVYKRQNITGDSSEKLTTLYKTPGNNLLSFAFNNGLYAFNNGAWKKIASANSSTHDVLVRCAFITRLGDTLLGSNRGLLICKHGNIEPFKINNNPVVNNIFCIEELNSGLWFGTDKGAFKIENSNLIHFNSKNGLTDNIVYTILKDDENNLWFASDADGIFKFKENNFSFYDKSCGFLNPIIMGVAQTSDGQIYAADYSGNVYTIDSKNQQIEQMKFSSLELSESKVNTIYADNKNNLYIGTLGRKVYCYNKKTGLSVVGEKSDLKLRGGNCFLRDDKDNLIVGGSLGLFIQKKNGEVIQVESPKVVFNALAQVDKQTIIIGNTNGIALLDSNYKLSFPKITGMENNEVLCLKYINGVAWLGTTENGVYRWDLKTNNVRQYNISEGLPSNFIYNIIAINNNDIWLGTGFGICNMMVDNYGDIRNIKNFSRSEGLIGMECNHNSELFATDSTLWFGTTKGLAHFKVSGRSNENISPFIILKSVKLFSSNITDSSLCSSFSDWYNIPMDLSLSAKQNHLTFELTGIYLSNPDDIRFKYKLQGIDKEYTISNNPVINYPALPPGKYTLIVQAITKSGVLSSNTVNYSFEIRKAFYQTATFIALCSFLLIGSSGLIVFLYVRKKQNEKLLREKIREEEFTKLRQRTAEDFHDEMGNKLTRISILTDILKSKVSGTETEAMNIVNQIKENTTALYNGSRDIIWSLNSKNDNFYEITEHVKTLGQEIFSETSTQFRFDHNIKSEDNIKLKLDYSRNLIMIFKEVYNNILKHSQAAMVSAKIELVDNSEALIMISDNGKGFNVNNEYKGNGLKNIQNRIRRINGTFSINSSANNGTEIMISLKDIFQTI